MQSIHWLILIIIIIIVLICILLYCNSKNVKSDKKLIFLNYINQLAPLQISDSATGNVLYTSTVDTGARLELDDFGKQVTIKFTNQVNPEFSIENVNLKLMDKHAKFVMHEVGNSTEFYERFEDTQDLTLTLNFDICIGDINQLCIDDKNIVGIALDRPQIITNNNIYCVKANKSTAVTVTIPNVPLKNATCFSTIIHGSITYGSITYDNDAKFYFVIQTDNNNIKVNDTLTYTIDCSLANDNPCPAITSDESLTFYLNRNYQCPST